MKKNVAALVADCGKSLMVETLIVEQTVETQFSTNFHTDQMNTGETC